MAAGILRLISSALLLSTGSLAALEIIPPNPPDCPPIEFCTPGDIASSSRKAYPPDCSKYISCADNQLANCPRGLHYNHVTRLCSWPREANCTECLEFSTPQDMCPPIESCTSEQLGILKPYPPDCTKYIYCDGITEGIIQNCQIGRHFSPSLLFCTEPEVANCPICTTTELTSTTLALCPEPDNCTLNETGVLKPYPSDCGKYIYCDEFGEGRIQVCPSNQHFSPVFLFCMDPDTANCPFCMTLEPTLTTVLVCSEPETCTPEEQGHFKPYPPDCNLYIYCGSNGPELRFCPIGQHFSPITLFCMTPELAKCPQCITTIPSSTTVSICPLPEPCSVNEVGFLKPYPSDCTKYIYCDGDGNGILNTCPLGKHFSPVVLHCTEPEIAMCPYCIATESTVTTVGVCPITEYCTPEEFAMLKPYPPDCGMFLYCDGSEGNLSNCPGGQHFSPTLLRCTEPELANCPFCMEPSTTTPMYN